LRKKLNRKTCGKKEFETKGEKIAPVFRKCSRNIKNTIRVKVVVIKMRIIGTGKVKREDCILENRTERK
jgi:hypothetical protein